MTTATLIKSWELNLIEWFTSQRFGPLASGKEAWWHVGRHGAESSTSKSAGNRRYSELLGLA